jgi:hypothetical protein
MEKFLAKRQRLSSQSEDAHCENTTSDSPGPSNSVKVPSQTNSSSCAVRKYHDCYLSCGFTYSVSENHPRPACVVRGEKLCNVSMVLSKLKRNFNTKHSHLIDKDTAYFSRLLSSQVKQVKSMGKIATISEKAQVASYKVDKIISRNMQPHTILETLMLPACKQIVKSVLGGGCREGDIKCIFAE